MPVLLEGLVCYPAKVTTCIGALWDIPQKNGRRDAR
jgi:hypothetical protein